MSVEQAVKDSFQTQTPNGFLYRLAEDFPAFKGHFDAYAVLPAVCQISLCSDAASRLLGYPVQLRALKRAKFLRPVLPQTDILVCLSSRPDGSFLAELINAKDSAKISQLTLQFTEKSK
ncbi:hypothetical protein [Candidatus Avelusimicrobium luingense]|uniref:hypothetical protein n=1 Tax=Candidatus Avelusimicrobium luingense TaxID=3416211 RepID=UPI003D0A0276